MLEPLLVRAVLEEYASFPSVPIPELTLYFLSDGDQIPTFLEQSFIGLHMEDGEYVPRGKLPSDWYSSHGYGDKMVQYLRERKERGETRPFFGYLPFTAPH
jgi:hypothetical protein